MADQTEHREPLDLAEVRATWLQQCGPCDYGLVEYGCNCPPGDHRPVLLRAVDELEQARERLAMASQFTVSLLAVDSIDRHLFDLTVEERAPGQWAVCRWRECLDAKGRWHFEPRPSERDDRWKARHRFDLDTALRLAREAAPDVVCNGVTARQAADRAGGGNQ